MHFVLFDTGSIYFFLAQFVGFSGRFFGFLVLLIIVNRTCFGWGVFQKACWNLYFMLCDRHDTQK